MGRVVDHEALVVNQNHIPIVVVVVVVVVGVMCVVLPSCCLEHNPHSTSSGGGRTGRASRCSSSSSTTFFGKLNCNSEVETREKLHRRTFHSSGGLSCCQGGRHRLLGLALLINFLITKRRQRRLLPALSIKASLSLCRLWESVLNLALE